MSSKSGEPEPTDTDSSELPVSTVPDGFHSIEDYKVSEPVRKIVGLMKQQVEQAKAEVTEDPPGGASVSKKKKNKKKKKKSPETDKSELEEALLHDPRSAKQKKKDELREKMKQAKERSKLGAAKISSVMSQFGGIIADAMKTEDKQEGIATLRRALTGQLGSGQKKKVLDQFDAAAPQAIEAARGLFTGSSSKKQE